MGMGYLADRNEVAESHCTITSNATWLPSGPLDALRTTPLIDAAVSSDLGTEGAPVWIEFAWEFPVDLTYTGIHDTNLRQASGYRVEAWFDAAKTQQAFTTQENGRDRKVVPPLTDPAKMRFGAPNQLRGDLDPRDFRLYPTNVHVTVPLCRARVLRWSFWGSAYEADDTDAAGYRIGLAWAGDGLSFDRHVGGSGESIKSNDERIETPGGGVWVEPGISKRVALIDRTVTDKTLRDALFDMANRAGKHKPMVWLPDTDSPADCFRYGGLFRRFDDHGHKYIAPQYTSGGLELEEWKE